MRSILIVVVLAFSAVLTVSLIKIYNRGELQISSLSTLDGLSDLAWKEGEQVGRIADDVLGLIVKGIQDFQGTSTEQSLSFSEKMMDETSLEEKESPHKERTHSLNGIGKSSPLQSHMDSKEPINTDTIMDISKKIASLSSEGEEPISTEDIQKRLETLNEVNMLVISLPSSMNVNEKTKKLWMRIVNIQCHLFPKLRKEYLSKFSVSLEKDALIDGGKDTNIEETTESENLDVLKVFTSSSVNKDLIISSSAFEKEDSVSLNFLEPFSSEIFALRFEKIVLKRPKTAEKIILHSTEYIDDGKIVLFKDDLYKVVKFSESFSLPNCTQVLNN